MIFFIPISKFFVPNELYVPKGIDPDSEVVGADLEPDLSSSHVEEVEEVEIIDNDSEVLVVDAEEDEEGMEVEESSANNDDVSSEGVGVETAKQIKSETTQGAPEEDQDVFKALDEAERADNAFSSPKTGPDTTESKTNDDSEKVPIKSQGQSRRNGTVFLVIFLLCAVIVAIVLPFYIDYPSGLGTKESSHQDSPESPSDVSTPEASPEPTDSPLTSIPTGPPTDAPTTLQWGQFLNAFLIPNSGEEVFQDKDSPQYRAAKFVLDDPYTDMVSTTGRLNDRYATITFYFATEGENWKSCYFGDADCASGQWLEGDICDWYAVSCDDDGRVISFLFGML